MKHPVRSLAFAFACLTLAGLTACGPGVGATRNDPLAGPYRVLSVTDVFAEAPKLKPDGDMKAFMRERLDWAYAPGRPPLAVMDPESDLRMMPDVSPETVYAAEAALAGEGHLGAQLLAAMDAQGGSQP
jgi:hypothetical protein